MPNIQQLNAADKIYPGDLLPMWSTDNGDTRKISMTLLAQFLSTAMTASGGMISQYAAPSANAFTVVITNSASSVWLILTPTAGFAAGTIRLPDVYTATDKQEVLVNCTQAVTAILVDGNGATVTGAPTGLAANEFFRLRYDAVTKTWYRVG